MIDWTKPIETVDGLPARVISTDYKGNNRLPLYVVQIEGRHFSHIGYYRVDGNPHTTCDRIRNVRVKREGWVIKFKGKDRLWDFHIYSSEETAVMNVLAGTVHEIVRIQWEEEP